MSDFKVQPERINLLMSRLTAKYAVIPGTTMTVCALQLPNGFVVATGESACIDPANFNRAKGEEIAQANALLDAESKLWQLEGYRKLLEAYPL